GARHGQNSKCLRISEGVPARHLTPRTLQAILARRAKPDKALHELCFTWSPALALTCAHRHNELRNQCANASPRALFRVPPRRFGSQARLFSSIRHGDLTAMMVTRIIDAFGYVIYAALALLAVWGVYNGILLYRTLMKKTIREPEQFIDQVRDLCEAR